MFGDVVHFRNVQGGFPICWRESRRDAHIVTQVYNNVTCAECLTILQNLGRM
jgi:hypothetical protein